MIICTIGGATVTGDEATLVSRLTDLHLSLLACLRARVRQHRTTLCFALFCHSLHFEGCTPHRAAVAQESGREDCPKNQKVEGSIPAAPPVFELMCLWARHLTCDCEALCLVD